jgi:hypothetical protein
MCIELQLEKHQEGLRVRRELGNIVIGHVTMTKCAPPIFKTPSSYATQRRYNLPILGLQLCVR